MRSYSIPLYSVVVSGLDDATAVDCTMSNARSYAAALEGSGIPSTIYFYRSISVQDYLNGNYGRA